MRLRPRQLALALALLPASALAQTVEVLGSFDWETDAVVGVSGLEVDADGSRFLAVSDQGWWLEGRLKRNADAIVGVELERLTPILGEDGLPVAARRVGDWSDAEGLAITEDGDLYVVFERWAHVWRYDDPLGAATNIKSHETFRDFSENWQLEAIAVAPDGTLYAISEKPLAEGFPLYRLDGKAWVIDRYLPEQDIFSVVGADFDPATGDLYLLERKLVVGIWWQSRLRRIKLDGSEDIALWTSERGEYGNLEGIGVWHDDDGLRITLVADDNADKDAPTQFLELRLTE